MPSLDTLSVFAVACVGLGIGTALGNSTART
jgi:hypothetical protein